MGFPVAAIPILGSIIDKVIDKVAKDKIDDATMAKIKNEAQQALRNDMQEDVSTFYDFIVRYEGAAEDMPRVIQILRGTVRPILTYVFSAFFVYITWLWLVGENLPDNAEFAIKLVFAVNILVLGFWFGERALQRSGVIDLLKEGKKKQ